MEEITSESTQEIVRDSQGKFVKGNKEGRKFMKGSAGKPKGARNRKNLVAREFALDVLHLDAETGKQMTYKELCMYIKKKADQSPRILNLLLDHALGKPLERHKQEQRVIFNVEGLEEFKQSSTESNKDSMKDAELEKLSPKEVKPAVEEGVIIERKETYMLEEGEE